MRTLRTLAALVLSLGAGACLFQPGDGSAAAGGFVVPAGAVQIANGVYVASGRKVSEPFPPPSAADNRPVITAGQWKNTGPNSFALGLSVRSPIPIQELHLELGGAHFIVTGSGGSTDIDACAMLQQQQGYGCTKACVDACSCASCTEAIYETNAEGSCSVTCSTLSHDGGLSQAPYNGSEVTFADVIYNGYVDAQGVKQVSGLLDSFASCSGSVCADAAAAEKVVWFDMYIQDWSFLDALDDIGCGVGTPPTEKSSPMMSNKSNAGSATFKQAKACDPGACPH